MAARGYDRGWPVTFVSGQWVYDDTRKPLDDHRPCAKCGQPPTAEGYDACTGYVVGKTSVCCGHGVQATISI